MNNPRLIIGGYELAFLSNLFLKYIIKVLDSILCNGSLLNEIYKDNRMLVTREK